MDHLSFQNRIQVYGHHLSKSERKIAAYIVEHPEQARLASSRELAMSTGTSNSTLTRFCQNCCRRLRTIITVFCPPPANS